MPRNITAGNIITQARYRADYENSQHVSDSELTTYVDRAWARLYARYVRARPLDFRKEVEITTTGATSYAVVSDYYATIGVDYKSGTSYSALSLLQEYERNQFQSGVTGTASKYLVANGALFLYPIPPTGQAYRHVYVPVPSSITQTTDVIDGRIGHEQLIELIVARRILQKAGTYNGHMDAEIAQYEDEIDQEILLREVQNATTCEPDRWSWDDPPLRGDR